MYKPWAVFTGLLIAIMVTFNGVLANQIGGYSSVLIVHIVGLITISLILIIGKKKINFKRDIPVYMFSAGAIGVVLVFFNSVAFNKLGVSLTLAIGLFGQLIVSGIVDNFGIFGMDMHKFRSKKFIGLALILLGIIVMMVY